MSFSKSKLFDTISYIIAAASLLISFLLFYNDTGEFQKSLAAAAMAAGLIWASYIIIRMCYLAGSSKE